MSERENVSVIHKFFDKDPDNDPEYKQCIDPTCKKSENRGRIKFPNGGTSGGLKHYQTVHRIDLTRLSGVSLSGQKKLDQYSKAIDKTELGVVWAEIGLPFEAANKPHFKKFFEICLPNTFHDKVARECLDAAAAKYEGGLKTQLKGAACSLLLDGWKRHCKDIF